MPKCAFCKTDIKKENVIKYIDKYSKKEKKVNMCSVNCIKEYEHEQEIKKQETKNYINLCEYIMKIHKQTFLPSGFYVILRELRDGTIRQKGIYIKKYKQGVEWKDIFNAYKYSENSINRVLSTKTFETIMNELNYCLAIVKNNLAKSKQINQQKQMNEKIETKVHIADEYEYKKKEDSSDISDILE